MTSQGTQPFQLAPEQLWQAINPWSWTFDGNQVSLFSVNIGATRSPETERAVLDEVGSYGRQLGHIGDALEVLIRHFERTPDGLALGEKERDTLDVLKGDLARIRGIKVREAAKG